VGVDGVTPEARHSATAVSRDDRVRVVSRALAERGRRLHLTAGQRRAILGGARPGPAGA